MKTDFIDEYLKQNADEIYPYFVSKRKKYLFGAGQQAINCVYLFRLLGIELDGILVSQRTVDKFYDLPVWQMDSLNADKQDVAVLMALNPVTAVGVRGQLENLGYDEIYICQDWEKTNDAVKEAVSLDFYRNNGTDISSEYIQLKQCRFLNPFREDRRYRQMLMGTTFTDLIVPGIFKENIYQNRLMYDIIEKSFNNAEVVFDVGANAGIFAGYAAALGMMVTAFEPSRSILPYLHRNASLYSSIRIEESAVCGEDGESPFYDKEDYPKYSTLLNPGVPDYKVYQVKTISLDTYISDTGLKPQFIRIYVNGSAKQVIHGGKQYILDNRPIILIGLEHEPDVSGIKKMILECNTEYQMLEWGGYLYFY